MYAFIKMVLPFLLILKGTQIGTRLFFFAPPPAPRALELETVFARVQQWLGQASISTTDTYDRHKPRQEDSPTFRAASEVGLHALKDPCM
ncbi:hypothetical protein DM872_08050 [Pseudomonas taiwanensis]|nr:hypothetical protein [Pseudomonas taiwanensis]